MFADSCCRALANLPSRIRSTGTPPASGIITSKVKPALTCGDFRISRVYKPSTKIRAKSHRCRLDLQLRGSLDLTGWRLQTVYKRLQNPESVYKTAEIGLFSARRRLPAVHAVNVSYRFSSLK